MCVISLMCVPTCGGQGLTLTVPQLPSTSFGEIETILP